MGDRVYFRVDLEVLGIDLLGESKEMLLTCWLLVDMSICLPCIDKNHVISFDIDWFVVTIVNCVCLLNDVECVDNYS